MKTRTTKIITENTKQIKKFREQMNECGFFFIEPQRNTDARSTAQKLLSINNISEVFITDGDYGFIAKTNASDDRTLEYIAFTFLFLPYFIAIFLYYISFYYLCYHHSLHFIHYNLIKY